MQGDFQAGRIQGIGEGGLGFGSFGEAREMNANYAEADLDIQHIKTPTVVNTAYQEAMLWNGQFGAQGINQGTEQAWTVDTPLATNNLGFQGLETQAIAGLGVHRLDVTEALVTNLGYKAMFDAVFSDIPVTERYTKVTAGLAIGAFERVVIANEAPFQKWLAGDVAALNQEQKEGAILFFGKANCFECHNGPALNSMQFKALGIKDLEGAGIIGVPDDAGRKGRGGFTGKEEDMYAFKVPQLYNIKNAGFYGHGASFTSVKDIIAYKNTAVAENSLVPENKLSTEFAPLGLTEAEITKIASFIEEGLYDDNLYKYEPSSVMSQLCFPNNDPVSKADMGCN
jgi:cytochrome c peroxidase